MGHCHTVVGGGGDTFANSPLKNWRLANVSSARAFSLRTNRSQWRRRTPLTLSCTTSRIHDIYVEYLPATDDCYDTCRPRLLCLFSGHCQLWEFNSIFVYRQRRRFLWHLTVQTHKFQHLFRFILSINNFLLEILANHVFFIISKWIHEFALLMPNWCMPW